MAEAALAAVADSDAADPPLRLFIASDPVAVRRAAAEATARHAAGAPLSALDGVPYAVIDAIDAEGYPTTAGTSFLGAARRVTGDAPAVAALRAAGAVLLGKANCHEARREWDRGGAVQPRRAAFPTAEPFPNIPYRRSGWA